MKSENSIKSQHVVDDLDKEITSYELDQAHKGLKSGKKGLLCLLYDPR